MTYTEEEAKTKWCPFARVFNGQSVASGNRDLQDVPYDILRVNCIGYDCMAWRRSKDAWKRPDGKVIQTQIAPPDERGHWVRQGFCGLAGQP